MAKAAGEGRWIGDYIKNCEPEHVVCMKLERGELRYTWIDNGNARASDDGGPQRPEGWWLRARIDREEHSVKPGYDKSMRWISGPDYGPSVSTGPMYHVRIVGPAVEQAAQKAPRRGRPSPAPLVVEEARRRLEGRDRAGHIRRGRKDFLEQLLGWLRATHKEAKPTTTKTIGGHLRNDEKIRALMPKGWYRQT